MIIFHLGVFAHMDRKSFGPNDYYYYDLLDCDGNLDIWSTILSAMIICDEIVFHLDGINFPWESEYIPSLSELYEILTHKELMDKRESEYIPFTLSELYEILTHKELLDKTSFIFCNESYTLNSLEIEYVKKIVLSSQDNNAFNDAWRDAPHKIKFCRF